MIERKVWNKVFDKPTLMTIYHLFNKGIFTEILGEISSGKEAKIFVVLNDEPLVMKVYRVDAAAFENIWPYIKGDPRFRNVPKNRRVVINLWVRKEFRNLKRMYEAGARVPKPVIFMNNVLLMEFIGNEAPAPMLKTRPPAEPEGFFFKLLENYRKIYQIAELVHGDLSEYNVLNFNEEPVIIDVAQAVDLEHPLAREFLLRDVSNICRYFSRFIDCSESEVLDFITGGEF